MSQQEFEPQFQSQEQDAVNGEDKINYPQQPYYWSAKPANEAAPKDEPPSSYAGSTFQSGYQDQNDAPSMKQEAYGTGQQFSPNGDAYSQGYSPYNSYNSYNPGAGQNVPPFAQAGNYSRMYVKRWSPLRLVFFILLALLLIKPILVLGGLFLAAIGGFILFLLVPLLLLSMFFRRAFWPGYRHPRARYRYWRRGPWWF